MAVLVTGGAGFIGSHVAERLVARGERVIVVDNFEPFYDPAIKRANLAALEGNPLFRLVEADIADLPPLEREIEGEEIDFIVHLAARAGVRPSIAQPEAYARTNVLGTISMLELARKRSVRGFVFGSSSSVYGDRAEVPFQESDPVASPISPYAATKRAGELLCHTYAHLYGLGVVALRFFTVYGPRQRPDLAIHKFTRLLSRGEALPFFGDGSTRRDYTWVDDIVQGVRAAIDYNASMHEVINLGESETTELSRLIELLEENLGRRAVVDRQPVQPGDVPVTFADISKARRLLGYAPATKIEDGIPKFVEWFLSSRTETADVS
jgi:UDP-glucuronate 4-epimerase